MCYFVLYAYSYTIQLHIKYGSYSISSVKITISNRIIGLHYGHFAVLSLWNDYSFTPGIPLSVLMVHDRYALSIWNMQLAMAHSVEYRYE